METPDLLKHFPWATLGRREVPSDFFRKVDERRGFVPLFKEHPIFSVVIPLTNKVAIGHFQECLESLVLQAHPRWEAILITAEHLPEYRHLVEARQDTRFKWIECRAIQNEIALKNEGARRARGAWLGFMGAGDVLSPAALYEVAKYLENEKNSSLIYTNEVTIDSASKTLSNFLSKPEFSWFNLIHFNAIGVFWLVRRSLFGDRAGFDEHSAGHHVHDFLLKLSEGKYPFRLIPQFLVYKRHAKTVSEDKEGLGSIVQEHLRRIGFGATVRQVRSAGRELIKVTPVIKNKSEHLISVIIPFKDRASDTIRALSSLLRQVGDVPVEVVLINNRSSALELQKVKEAAASAASLSSAIGVSVINYDPPFNYAHLHNWVIQNHAQGDLIVFLNNDVFWQDERALDEMAAWALQSWVGVVGILLRFPNGGIQHAGFRCVYGGRIRLARITHVQEEDGFPYENKEVFGVTFAAAMVKRTTFGDIGGLRELDLPNGSGDVAFNFECIRRGLGNIYLGHLEAIHLESASRGIHYEYWETCTIEREYPDILQKMLRCDLGYNRIPGAEISFKSFLRHDVGFMIFEKAKWLMPLKPAIRWFLKRMSHA